MAARATTLLLMMAAASAAGMRAIRLAQGVTLPAAADAGAASFSQASPSPRLRSLARNGVLNQAVTPRSHSPRCSLPPEPSSFTAESCSLQALLERLAPLGPVRTILVAPGGAAILEASSDSARWSFKTTTMPSGKTLLTTALPPQPDADIAGPLFEFHLDVGRAARASLGISQKTGGPIVRIIDVDGGGMLTLLPSKDHLDKFQAMIDELGEEVSLLD
eukprot:2961130-Pleurochrysis_carterae.AAC.1